MTLARLLTWTALCAAASAQVPVPRDPPIALTHDAANGRLTVSIRGRDAFAYQHHRRFALPHVSPLRSPSGKSLTVQKTEPFPHHRSLWIADRVQLENGRIVDFYHCTKNLRDARRPELGFTSYIRHDGFSDEWVDGDTAAFAAKLTWVVDGKTPVLEETRRFGVRDLGRGEYLIDLSWKLTASFGPVTFHSDWVHYAWPYLRMHPRFSGQAGGTITDNRGRSGQKATNGKTARWIDYSNTVEGVTEGVTVFVFPDGKQRKWLTREYGTFGPRRPDDLSGTRFTLARGEFIEGRVGILVHRGDCARGRVAERYRAYTETVQVSRGADSIRVHRGERSVLEYRRGAAGLKPYVVRLHTPKGVNVVRDAPTDHVHHHGLMLALGVDDVDFWGEVHATVPGRQRERSLDDVRVRTRSGRSSGAFTQLVDWVDPRTKKPILVEKRRIEVSAGEATLLTWRSSLKPPPGSTSAALWGRPYFGLGMRFSASMDGSGRFVNADGKPGETVRGDERLTAARWCAYLANAAEQPVTVAMFDHPENPRHPATWFTMAKPFAYLTATLDLNRRPLKVDAADALSLRYGVALWDGHVGSRKIEDLYRRWVASENAHARGR